MLDNQIKLSIVIPSKTNNSQMLRELMETLKWQDMSRSNYEVLVITDGTSESAKAIGIRQAKGEVICIMASDNFLPADCKSMLSAGYDFAMKYGSAYPMHYFYNRKMNLVDRYCALIGGNDPLAYYMGKNDRCSWSQPQLDTHSDMAFGDNGFFIRRDIIMQSDLDNYYHIDNVYDVRHLTLPFAMPFQIVHRTGGSIFKLLRKRYKYGLQHAFNSNRRWHLVDFRNSTDTWRLSWFVLASLTFIQPFAVALRGFLRIMDLAWFLHPVMCFLTVVNYTILMIHLGVRRLSLSSSARMDAQRV